MFSIHWIHNTLRNKSRTTFLGKISSWIFSPKKPEHICFVTATRLTEANFWNESPLGVGLKPLLDDPTISSKIKFENTDGLPAVYNAALKSEHQADIIVFLHDDIWIEDKEIVEKIRAALRRFDVMGVAGNRRISKMQPAWHFRTVENNQFIWDHGHLSGEIRHGTPGRSEPSVYGPTPASCELLDGVLLAARRRVLQRSNVRFDEQFMFHFYDMDFCRSARQAGIHLGTWPMDVLHLSAGAFGPADWHAGYNLYMRKWKY